jgi:NADPH:quinone reductase-like Zn-dependent oxidoreductase
VVVKSPYEAHPLAPGTPVFGMAAFPRSGGTYGEYAVVPSLSVARKPASLSHVEAAGVPLAALTAWGLIVETAHAHEGQRILIHAGGGGVGHFAVQFAAYFGAHVTATASGRNAAWLRELGAAVVIDHTTTRFEEVIADVDVVIDLIGNEHGSTGTRSLEVLRPGGLYVVVATGSWPEYAEAAEAAGVRATSYKVIPDGGSLATIARLLDSGAVQVYIDRVFPLDEAAAAHRMLEEGHTRGKIVLRVSDD